MITIKYSLLNPNTHFTFNGLEYRKDLYILTYGNIELDSTGAIVKPLVTVGLRHKNDSRIVLTGNKPINEWSGPAGIYADLDSLMLEVSLIISFKEDIKIGLTQKVNTFGDLISGSELGDLAYVEGSQGTYWLPNTLGGTYYPAGWYVWNGTDWVSDRDAIANQLEQNILTLSDKADISSLGAVAFSNDYNDLDNTPQSTSLSWGYYATNIQYTGLTGVIATGQVLTGEIGNITVYRFISAAQTGLYPTEDSFYSTFDGTTLSDLIVTR